VIRRLTDKLYEISTAMNEILLTWFGFIGLLIGLVGIVIIHYIFGLKSTNGHMATLLLISLAVSIAGSDLFGNLIKGRELTSYQKIASISFLLIIISCVVFALVIFFIGS
jgi:hypothetical protein